MARADTTTPGTSHAHALRSACAADVRALAEVGPPPLATVTAPFHATFPGAHENRLELRRARTAVVEGLVREGLAPGLAERRAAPIESVDVDPRNLAHELAGRTRGVALFVGPERVHAFALAEELAASVRVADCFALRPLLRAVASDARFRVLALSANAVALFEGDAHGLRPGALPDLPASLEEALGKELEGHRIGLVSSPAAAIHGARFYATHDANAERALDLERFHRAIARALEKIAAAGEAPLVLATDQSNAGRFRKIAHLPALLEATAVGNPDLLGPDDLHARTWPVVAADLERRLQALAADYERARSLGKGTTAIDRIATAALAGRVRRLWILEGAFVPGRLDPVNGRVVAAENARDGDVLDSLATAVLRRGGDVIVAAAERFPAPAAAAAELR